MKPQTNFFKKSFPFFAFFIAAAFLFWQFSPSAESASETAPDEERSNYDIRTAKTDAARRKIETFSELSGRSDASAATEEKKSRRAEHRLRAKFANLKIERGDALNFPEIISPDVENGQIEFLTAPAPNEKRVAILRRFLTENAELFGLDDAQIALLEVTADYTNPDGQLSFVHLAQKIGGVPVFSGEVKAGFTKQNEIVGIVNNLAPNISDETLSNDFGSAERAVSGAAQSLAIKFDEGATKRTGENSPNDARIVFERTVEFDSITAEKFYFPIAPGVARAAWRVYLETPKKSFYAIVDASDGTLLWRKTLTEHQTQAATYNVYGNLTSLMKTADSPSPFTPGCIAPTGCAQPPAIARTNFTLIGNEAPYTFNNTGWIPDGENRTIGNNIEAGIDRVTPNGIDDNGWAFGNPTRVFSYSYNPAPGNPPPGEEPLPSTQTYPPSAFQQGAITHAFYTANRWHDETYLLGFTEAAGNFQTNNFGRGGIGNDSISVEIQDSSGTSGANFSVGADGVRPRAQFYIWTGPTPDRDGALDSQTVVHELSHGLSSRLHGNSTGLTTNMARAMGEGWSDFYALALLSEPTDARLATYTVAGYSTYQATTGYESNYYYGIRRFPTAVWEFTGAAGCRHNPLTFADIDSTQYNVDNACFPAGPFGSGSPADQIHNASEIWLAFLWEVRDKLIQRHGAAEGNRRALKYVTDGMKLAPLNPTFLQERDAILVAAQINDPTDVSHVWAGFALRGLGSGASIQNAGTGTGTTRVTESFASPGVSMTNPYAVSDVTGNGDGYFDPGETIQITASLANSSGASVTNAAISVNGGASVSYGTIANGQTVTRQFNYQIPTNAPCPGDFNLVFTISSSLGTSTETRRIALGRPLTAAVSFSNTTPIDVPAGQPTATNGPANPYPSTISVSNLSGPKNIRVTLNNFRHEYEDDVDVLLVSPSGQKFLLMSDVGGSTEQLTPITFSIADSGAGLLPDTTAIVGGTTYKPSNVDTISDAFPAPAPAAPYVSAAPAGTGTFASAFGTNGATMNGAWNLYVFDDVAGDPGRIEGGWTLTFESPFVCVVCRMCLPPLNSRADFDGDGRTDLSVFRPADGNWYLSRSVAGFTSVAWGVASDRLVPGDYDGDGKTDVAVYRGGSWYILKSGDSSFQSISWGTSGDTPVIGDFDGDGKTDAAVFRTSDGNWYILRSSDNQLAAAQFGQSGDLPISGDFDGDGRTDLAVYRGGTWYLQRSSSGFAAVSFGLSSDDPVPADYDGDGRTDLAVFRFTEGVWYRINSTNGQVAAVAFGVDGDIPVPGDYDGDGRADQAVYRNGAWYLNRSSNGFAAFNFGTASDKPVPKAYIP